MKEQANSKNTSINSKASGNLTANSRKEHTLKAEINNFKKMQRGNSSTSLQTRKRENSDSKSQQMKINIISNFFNKDNNPIVMKLKNEFSNLKSIPNYKFLDISKINLIKLIC
jgi:hypothetical protein